MKKFLAGLVVGLILATAATAVAAPQAIRLIVNGKEVPSDPAPQMIRDRVFVPIRVVSEALGAEVKWDDATQSVTITQQVVQPVAAETPSSGIIETSKSVPMGGDSVPQPEIQYYQIENPTINKLLQEGEVIMASPNIVYVALLGIEYSLGISVAWDRNTKQIILYSDPAGTQKLIDFDSSNEVNYVLGDPVIYVAHRHFILLSELQSKGIITGYQIDQENKTLTITTP